AVFSRLAELLHRAERSESVLAVVLTGAGGYFTSGADIKELQNDGRCRKRPCTFRLAQFGVP
ncbi:unnamed protein product, partial [Scytosiphon promiscuus]